MIEVECVSCLGDFDENKVIKCTTCNESFCKECIRQYHLTTLELPHCMNCKAKWPNAFLKKSAGKSWVDSKYKNHRKNILFDHEKSKLPSTMPAVKSYVTIKKLRKENIELKQELNFIKNECISDMYHNVYLKMLDNLEIEKYKYLKLFGKVNYLHKEGRYYYEITKRILKSDEKIKQKIYKSTLSFPEIPKSKIEENLSKGKWGINSCIFKRCKLEKGNELQNDCDKYCINRELKFHERRFIHNFNKYNERKDLLTYDISKKQFLMNLNEDKYEIVKNGKINTNLLTMDLYKMYFNSELILHINLWSFENFVDRFKRITNYIINDCFANNPKKNKIIRKTCDNNNMIWQIKWGNRKPQEKDKKQFVQRCAKEGCKGFLSKSWKCDLCDRYTCSKCLELKPLKCNKNCPKDCKLHSEIHVCDEEKVKTVALIKKETVNCPNCSMGIYKISGCDQMWCTSCNIAFNWKTGRKINGVIHNPHYFEWKAKEGQRIRQPTEIVCGGLPHYGSLNFKLQKYLYLTINKYFLKTLNNITEAFDPEKQFNDFKYHFNRYIDIPDYKIEFYDDIAAKITKVEKEIDLFDKCVNLYRSTAHIQDVELRKIRAKCNNRDNDFNEDLRIKYLTNERNEKQIKSTLLRRDRAINKSLSIVHIYEFLNTTFIESINDIFGTCNEFEHKLNKKYKKKNSFSSNPPLEYKENVVKCITKNLDRCEKIRRYSNDELAKISIEYKQMVPFITKKYEIKNTYAHNLEKIENNINFTN